MFSCCQRRAEVPKIPQKVAEEPTRQAEVDLKPKLFHKEDEEPSRKVVEKEVEVVEPARRAGKDNGKAKASAVSTTKAASAQELASTPIVDSVADPQPIAASVAPEPSEPAPLLTYAGGSFTGSSFVDLRTAPHSFSQTFGGALSVSFSGRWDALHSWSRIIDFGGAGPGVDSITIANTDKDNTLVADVYSGARRKRLLMPSALKIGETHRYLLTISASGCMRMLRDGELLGELVSGYVPKVVERTRLYVGGSSWDTDSLFQGRIAELKLWSGVVEWSSAFSGPPPKDEEPAAKLEAPGTSGESKAEADERTAKILAKKAERKARKAVERPAEEKLDESPAAQGSDESPTAAAAAEPIGNNTWADITEEAKSLDEHKAEPVAEVKKDSKPDKEETKRAPTRKPWAEITEAEEAEDFRGSRPDGRVSKAEAVAARGAIKSARETPAKVDTPLDGRGAEDAPAWFAGDGASGSSAAVGDRQDSCGKANKIHNSNAAAQPVRTPWAEIDDEDVETTPGTAGLSLSAEVRKPWAEISDTEQSVDVAPASGTNQEILDGFEMAAPTRKAARDRGKARAVAAAESTAKEPAAPVTKVAIPYVAPVEASSGSAGRGQSAGRGIGGRGSAGRGVGVVPGATQSAEAKVGAAKKSALVAEPEEKDTGPPRTALEREILKVEKKVREVQKLRQRQEDGEALEKLQLDKISKAEEVEKKLEELTTQRQVEQNEEMMQRQVEQHEEIRRAQEQFVNVPPVPHLIPAVRNLLASPESFGGLQPLGQLMTGGKGFQPQHQQQQLQQQPGNGPCAAAPVVRTPLRAPKSGSVAFVPGKGAPMGVVPPMPMQGPPMSIQGPPKGAPKGGMLVDQFGDFGRDGPGPNSFPPDSLSFSGGCMGGKGKPVEVPFDPSMGQQPFAGFPGGPMMPNDAMLVSDDGFIRDSEGYNFTGGAVAFQPTGDGQDNSCWEYLNTGWCPRGLTCRWSHGWPESSDGGGGGLQFWGGDDVVHLGPPDGHLGPTDAQACFPCGPPGDEFGKGGMPMVAVYPLTESNLGNFASGHGNGFGGGSPGNSEPGDLRVEPTEFDVTTGGRGV